VNKSLHSSRTPAFLDEPGLLAGHHQLATDIPPQLRLTTTFTEPAQAI